MIFFPQAKLLVHGDRVKEWLLTGKTSPILFEIAPTGYCNATCPWCLFNGKKETSKIDSKVMLRTLVSMPKLGVKAINWSGGGEPTIHPEFARFVEQAHKCGLKQGLFTNGYNDIPYQNNFEWIRISLTDKGFSKIKKPKVSFGVCLNQIEEHTKTDIISFCLAAKKLGASYFQIRPALIDSYNRQPIFEIPKYLEKYSTNKFKVYVTDYKYDESIKPKDYNLCYGYHFCPSIDWNGKLSVCLYLTLNDSYILGDLNKTNLIDLWSKLPTKAIVTEKCQNCCKNHEINKILYIVKNIKCVDFL